MSRKPFVPSIPGPSWFFSRPRYIRYLARELSCVFILIYGLIMVVGLKRLSEGAVAWQAFLEALRCPVSIGFHIVALAFVLYHSITWFALTPKAMPMRINGKFISDGLISGSYYAAWVVLSLLVLIFAGVF